MLRRKLFLRVRVTIAANVSRVAVEVGVTDVVAARAVAVASARSGTASIMANANAIVAVQKTT